MATLDELEQVPLSNEDILTALRNHTNICTYSQLQHALQSGIPLRSLFKDGSLVVLYENTAPGNVGHWTALTIMPGGKSVEFFNSYGETIDDDSYMHGAKKALIQMIYDNGFKEIIYNDALLQGKDVATCGRHVIMRLLNKKIPIDDYVVKLKALAKSKHMTVDELVTAMTAKVGRP